MMNVKLYGKNKQTLDTLSLCVKPLNFNEIQMSEHELCSLDIDLSSHIKHMKSIYTTNSVNINYYEHILYDLARIVKDSDISDMQSYLNSYYDYLDIIYELYGEQDIIEVLSKGFYHFLNNVESKKIDSVSGDVILNYNGVVYEFNPTLKTLHINKKLTYHRSMFFIAHNKQVYFKDTLIDTINAILNDTYDYVLFVGAESEEILSTYKHFLNLPLSNLELLKLITLVEYIDLGRRANILRASRYLMSLKDSCFIEIFKRLIFHKTINTSSIIMLAYSLDVSNNLEYRDEIIRIIQSPDFNKNVNIFNGMCMSLATSCSDIQEFMEFIRS